MTTEHKPRWVETSTYRTQVMEQCDPRGDVRLLHENGYGHVVVWDEANQKDIPVICGHGGSMWLCMGCALIISGKRKGRVIDEYPNLAVFDMVTGRAVCAMPKPTPRFIFED